MKIEFDSDKDTVNRLKHGLSLADAERTDLRTAAIDVDLRYAYGEGCFQALGLIGERLHMLVFTMRGNVLRVISLRKANPREVRRYDEQT